MPASSSEGGGRRPTDQVHTELARVLVAAVAGAIAGHAIGERASQSRLAAYARAHPAVVTALAPQGPVIRDTVAGALVGVVAAVLVALALRAVRRRRS